MEETKDAVVDIYSKLPMSKKLDSFMALTPMIVSVKDDVNRNRFTMTQLKGEIKLLNYLG